MHRSEQATEAWPGGPGPSTAPWSRSRWLGLWTAGARHSASGALDSAHVSLNVTASRSTDDRPSTKGCHGLVKFQPMLFTARLTAASTRLSLRCLSIGPVNFGFGAADPSDVVGSEHEQQVCDSRPAVEFSANVSRLQLIGWYTVRSLRLHSARSLAVVPPLGTTSDYSRVVTTDNGLTILLVATIYMWRWHLPAMDVRHAGGPSCRPTPALAGSLVP